MSQHALQQPIEELWERRDHTVVGQWGARRSRRVEAALELLDSGAQRVAEPTGGWMAGQPSGSRRAVLLSFRLTDSVAMEGPGGAPVVGQGAAEIHGDGGEKPVSARRGFRAVPGCGGGGDRRMWRPGAVLMPSFVNVGAWVGRNTMVDTWGDGGKLRADWRQLPSVGAGSALAACWNRWQANPVIIEDDCFIGARSEVAEGCGCRARWPCCRWGGIHWGIHQGGGSRDRTDPCRAGAVVFRGWWPGVVAGGGGCRMGSPGAVTVLRRPL